MTIHHLSDFSPCAKSPESQLITAHSKEMKACIEGGQGVEHLKENEREQKEAWGTKRWGEEMWMINDASSNWTKKYGCCPVCIAGENQRQRCSTRHQY